MNSTFVSAVTDEAIQRICYNGGGWELTPYRAAISENNILQGITILDENNQLTPEAVEILTRITSEDYNLIDRWFESPFSAVSKTGSNKAVSTLTHHIVIPADYSIGAVNTKNIGTIFFIYQEHETENPFLYGVAVPTETLTFEAGITQSLFFNFSVQSSISLSDTSYVINYTYPQDINDHNLSSDVHDNLLKRDGSRTITYDENGNYGVLRYDGTRDWNNLPSTSLVAKEYIDAQINKLKSDNNLR